jgi:hypothetical protein
MSTSKQHDSKTALVGVDRHVRPALREAMQCIATIAIHDSNAVISDSSMTFRKMWGRTTISAEPMNVDTIDGLRIAEVFAIRTPLTSFKLFDEKLYSFINLFATTGAVVRDTNGNDLIVSRVPLFEGDEQALAELYTPFIGAWCSMPKSGTVRFAGFWPNMLYQPGTVTSIAFWSWARSRFARHVLAVTAA